MLTCLFSTAYWALDGDIWQSSTDEVVLHRYWIGCQLPHIAFDFWERIHPYIPLHRFFARLPSSWVVGVWPSAFSLIRWYTDRTEATSSFVYGQTSLLGSSIIGIGIQRICSASDGVTSCRTMSSFHLPFGSIRDCIYTTKLLSSTCVSSAQKPILVLIHGSLKTWMLEPFPILYIPSLLSMSRPIRRFDHPHDERLPLFADRKSPLGK